MDPEPTLPGEDLLKQGLADLGQGDLSESALLVLIASPRLKALGIAIPDVSCPRPYEHRLYEKIEQRLGPGAHSYYNSLLRRIVSYAHALEHERSASR